jgi:hypothetical protein
VGSLGDQQQTTMNDTLQTTHIQLRDCLLAFHRGIPDGLIATMPNLEFTASGRETLMNCAGFIAGIYYSGNITLADALAVNLIDNLSWRGRPEGSYCKIASDFCHMSFAFLQYFEVTESEYDSVIENRRTTRGYYPKRYYAMSFNGGIIFHGRQYLHCLDRDPKDIKWWSTHT